MVYMVTGSDLHLLIMFWEYILLMKDNIFNSKIDESVNGITKMTTLLILIHMETCNKIQKMTNLWFFSGSESPLILEDFYLNNKTQNTVDNVR